MNTMKTNDIRVRFAPSPTGFMHLGNVRAALINFLFARQKKGTFILRIEDTDTARNVDPNGMQLINDLQWLGIDYQEGPIKGGPYEPYYQSQRAAIYQRYLNLCIEKNLVYKCFCTTQELERKRERQLALKTPPRYDRACAILTSDEAQELTQKSTPYIWRFRIDSTKPVEFYDLAHKTMHFDLKHFSDIPVSRQDGSFTFMFANFVDDVEMRITHIFRGEDHLTNTASQVAMYQALGFQVPIFWHLPIIGNAEGKKLSKRDFGFSLTDLKNAGYLPEAICNYLAIIGASFEQEIMSIEQLVNAFNFENLSTTGQIRYDLEKLRWVNHNWIMHYDINKLTELCRPFLTEAYPESSNLSDKDLSALLAGVKTDLITLHDSVTAIEFYFVEPQVSQESLTAYGLPNYATSLQELIKIVKAEIDRSASAEEIAKAMQTYCKTNKLSMKDIFTLIRLSLTGKPQGPGIKDIISMLGTEESYKRLSAISK